MVGLNSPVHLCWVLKLAVLVSELLSGNPRVISWFHVLAVIGWLSSEMIASTR